MELNQALEMAEALTLDNENAISTLGSDGDEVAELLLEEIERLRDNRKIVNLAVKQREDETIFFEPMTATEAYLQDQLKELHGLIIDGVLSDVGDYDFEMESNPNGTTICGTLMRKHRMKRHHHSKTTCIYLGCNARV